MRIAATLAVAVLLWPATADAGLRGAEWGMTPEQVAEARAGEAPALKKPRGEGDMLVGNRGPYTEGGVTFSATYYYDDQGLALVSLDTPRKFDCSKLAQPLVGAYGKPLRTSDQTLFRLVIWHDTKSANRVRLMVSPTAGICTLHYERLSKYEAYDLAHPGAEVTPPRRTGR